MTAKPQSKCCPNLKQTNLHICPTHWIVNRSYHMTELHQIISWGSGCLIWNKSLSQLWYSIKRNYLPTTLTSQVME
jgi:hypothetical protein